MLGQIDLTSNNISKVEMKTTEPFSTREAIERLVKILDSTCAKANLEHVAANITHLKYEERNQLLRLLQYFEDLFDGTLGELDTNTVNIELKPDSKPFNCKYYLVPRINKETFSKEFKLLVKIGVLTPVHQSR